MENPLPPRSPRKRGRVELSGRKLKWITPYLTSSEPWRTIWATSWGATIVQFRVVAITTSLVDIMVDTATVSRHWGEAAPCFLPSLQVSYWSVVRTYRPVLIYVQNNPLYSLLVIAEDEFLEVMVNQQSEKVEAIVDEESARYFTKNYIRQVAVKMWQWSSTIMYQILQSTMCDIWTNSTFFVYFCFRFTILPIDGTTFEITDVALSLSSTC